MRKWLNVLAHFLLLFNGVGALYGGWNLMLHPDGSSIQLSLHWLEHTSFRDYQLPGMFLFIAIGLFSIVTLVTLLFRWPKSYLFVSVQGLILTSWIIIQIFLIQTIHFLHILLGSAGIMLMAIGTFLREEQSKV